MADDAASVVIDVTDDDGGPDAARNGSTHGRKLWKRRDRARRSEATSVKDQDTPIIRLRPAPKVPAAIRQWLREVISQVCDIVEHRNPAANELCKSLDDLRKAPTGRNMLPSKADVFNTAKRILSCQTAIGRVATVHLEKTGLQNMALAETIYRPFIFAKHSVVMGDMNTTWRRLIDEHGAVPATTHACATLPSTYLPGQQEQQRCANGDIRAGGYHLPAFDLVVVKRPLSVQCLEKQLAPKVESLKIPRAFMASNNWPSDHFPVMATVRAMDGQELVVGTWNVADPKYFGKYWPSAAFGFWCAPSEPQP